MQPQQVPVRIAGYGTLLNGRRMLLGVLGVVCPCDRAYTGAKRPIQCESGSGDFW